MRKMSKTNVESSDILSHWDVPLWHALQQQLVTGLSTHFSLTHAPADLSWHKHAFLFFSVKVRLCSTLMSRSTFLICWQEIIELYFVVTGWGQANDCLHFSSSILWYLLFALYYTSAHGQQVLKTSDKTSEIFGRRLEDKECHFDPL